jgi:hypothetical protein
VIARLRRSPKPPPEDELFASATDDPSAARPPDQTEIAQILLEQADYREYFANRGSGDPIADWENLDSSANAVLPSTCQKEELEQRQFELESLLMKLRLGMTSEEEAAAARDLDVLLRQLEFEWLWIKLRLGIASEEEAAAARDLHLLRQIAQADPPDKKRFRTPAAAWAYAQEEFGRRWDREPASVPGAVESSAVGILCKRRGWAAAEASAFRRELGKLPEQDLEQQRRTIADWVRMARKAGIVPPRPARPKGLPRRAPDS